MAVGLFLTAMLQGREVTCIFPFLLSWGLSFQNQKCRALLKMELACSYVLLSLQLSKQHTGLAEEMGSPTQQQLTLPFSHRLFIPSQGLC